jgi:hypothetical protein
LPTRQTSDPVQIPDTLPRAQFDAQSGKRVDVLVIGAEGWIQSRGDRQRLPGQFDF